MIRSELHDYIDQARKEGFSDEEIRKDLKAAGWPIDDINEALVEGVKSGYTYTPPSSTDE